MGIDSLCVVYGDSEFWNGQLYVEYVHLKGDIEYGD